MPKADAKHTSSRRKFLGDLAGSAAVVAVAAGASSIAQASTVEGPHPDAELIALCAELEAAARGIYEANAADENGDPPFETTAPFYDRIDDLAEQVMTRVPVTLDGFRALARAIYVNDPELHELDPSDCYRIEALSFKLVLDLMGDRVQV
jgi:hypothetical protein